MIILDFPSLWRDISKPRYVPQGFGSLLGGMEGVFGGCLINGSMFLLWGLPQIRT